MVRSCRFLGHSNRQGPRPRYPRRRLSTSCRAAVIYSSTFIFAKRQFDDEFHRLDRQIAAAARNLPGYLGEEAWENASTGLVSNVYYWSSLDALRQLMSNPAHLQAKAAQANWLAGYRVVISKVMRAYGDRDDLPGVVAFETP
jgi:heme-degrading monooxygenase HmoA